MKPASQQRALISSYILGDLAEDEQTRVEERYFEDDDFLLEVRAVRDDLIDSYVRGKLPEAVRLRFEQRMDEAPALRAEMEFAKALACKVGS